MISRLGRVLLAQALCTAVVGLHAEEAGNSFARFDIVRFAVDGNTLLPQSTVDDLTAPYTGKARDIRDVVGAQKALQDIYRKLGYTVVWVILPEQELQQGVVHIKVIETPLANVTVVGNRVFTEDNIRNSLPALRTGETPNLQSVSRSLKVANENPAKKIDLQLQAGDKEGEINARVTVVDEKTWSVNASIDNTGDTSSGRNHLNVQLQHANIANLDHVASLQYTTSLDNPGKVSVYGFGYHVPLYSLGDSLDFYGSHSEVDSGTVKAGILDLQVSGKGSTLGARFNHNFDRHGDYDSKLTGGIDYRTITNDVSLLGTPLGNEITVRPLSLTYSATFPVSAGVSSFYISGVSNMPGDEKGSSADFERVRSGASASYALLRYGASYSQRLPGDWQLRAVFNGQSTSDALVPSEQFGAGGAGTVRGFNEREISNDSGGVANLELYTPNWCSSLGRSPADCRLLAFYDNAYVSRNKALPGEQTQASIGSVGLGLRMQIDRYLTLQMDWGSVVDASDTQGKGEQRVHFKIAVNY
ncbi:MAG: ShlB/FhaC/HecB family hemolysin secretion/activation protein [Rhodoferax sp.]|nr:ShlB/FhaC/HecB family hemolysin secretion/activation protein [Rhodoferax sp.]